MPMLPLIDAGQKLDIALIGTHNGQPLTRSLNAHLTALFNQLFENNTQNSVTIQVSVNDAYHINPALERLDWAKPTSHIVLFLTNDGSA